MPGIRGPDAKDALIDLMEEERPSRADHHTENASGCGGEQNRDGGPFETPRLFFYGQAGGGAWPVK